MREENEERNEIRKKENVKKKERRKEVKKEVYFSHKSCWVEWCEWNWIISDLHNFSFPYASFVFCTLFRGCKFCFIFLHTIQINIFASWRPHWDFIQIIYFIRQKHNFQFNLVGSLGPKTFHTPMGSMIKSSCGLVCYLFISLDFLNSSVIFKNKLILFFDPKRALVTHDLGNLPFPNSPCYPVLTGLE